MDDTRRALLGAGLGASVVGAATLGGSRPAAAKRPGRITSPYGRAARDFGIVPNRDEDQSARLQRALDHTRKDGHPLWLEPGTYHARRLVLGDGSMLCGIPGKTILQGSASAPVLMSSGARAVTVDGITLMASRFHASQDAFGFVDCTGVETLLLRNITVLNAPSHAIHLKRCSGRVLNSVVLSAHGSGIFSLDGHDMEIAHDTIRTCGDNGILVWQSTERRDGALVHANHVFEISSRSGGTGQNGNGINVFRAGNVIVTANSVRDCAYSAIRGNAASNIQIANNSVGELGEVAIYAEFGFEGAVISNNVIDSAATGIAVTNFNYGGRLAVVQGNLVRNLKRRSFEPIDKRGDGITVEADASVTGNAIEAAPNVGLFIGWGKYMRNVVASSNMIRNAGVGIGISNSPDAGGVLVSHNLISGSHNGAIRAFDHHTPVGPDLSSGTVDMPNRIAVSANHVT